jgi:hypothetical protein
MHVNVTTWTERMQIRSMLLMAPFVVILIFIVGVKINRATEDRVATMEAFMQVRGDLIEGFVEGSQARTDEEPFFSSLSSKDTMKLTALMDELIQEESNKPSADPLMPPEMRTVSPIAEFVREAQPTGMAQPMGAWIETEGKTAFLLCRVQPAVSNTMLSQSETWDLRSSMIMFDVNKDGSAPELSFLGRIFTHHDLNHDGIQRLFAIQRGCLLDYIAEFR